VDALSPVIVIIRCTRHFGMYCKFLELFARLPRDVFLLRFNAYVGTITENVIAEFLISCYDKKNARFDFGLIQI